MGALDRFESSPKIRPMLNLGCLFDIPTGKYHVGAHGEHILNGGLAHITGIGGRGNTYKSTIAHYMMLVVAERYKQSEELFYDTELSLSYNRLTQLSKRLGALGEQPIEDNGRILLTDKTTIIGNKWYEQIKEICEDRRKNAKKYYLTSPFLDGHDQPIKVLNPFLVEVDSLSMMDFDVVDEMFDKNEVGSSKLNTEAMKGGAVKSQMLNQMPGKTGLGGMYVMFTAHVGDEFKMDPYAPSTKKLSFLKGDIKFKRVPETFTFLTNNLWHCLGARPLINKTTKGPEFPRNKDDNVKGDTDLMVIELGNQRAKNGPTGMPFDIIASQSEGIQVHLTQYWYIKNNGKFGIGGNDQNYYLHLLPDMTLSRTTIRGKINSEPKLRRALEITAELCQMKNVWHDMDRSLLMETDELYETLTKAGYDWNLLLDQTRGYWMFDEDITDDTPYFLSTMDLLQMAKGQYVPWWYDQAVKSQTPAKAT